MIISSEAKMKLGHVLTGVLLIISSGFSLAGGLLTPNKSSNQINRLDSLDAVLASLDSNKNENEISGATEQGSASQVNFGNLFGVKKTLSDKGIYLGINFKEHYFSNLQGGASHGDAGINNLHVTASFDLEQIAGLGQTSIFADVLSVNGSAPCDKAGAVQGISNMSALSQTRLYQLWIEKKLFDGNLSILAGLFDLNSEFDVRATSSVFINPSHGIGPDFSKSGLNGPSIFPSTSVALRLKIKPSQNTYILAGVFDGLCRNYDDYYLTKALDLKNDGVLLACETGLFENGEEFTRGYGKYSIGGWYYTRSFDDLTNVDLSGAPVQRYDNFGLYLSVEKFVISPLVSQTRGLAAFARIGFSQKNINPVQLYYSFGINVPGLFTNSSNDLFGLAVANANMSSKYLATLSGSGLNLRSNETIIEMTYSYKVLDWLKIQPDLQYVINPLLTSEDESLMTGVSFELNF